jgi:hypothetical protein
LSAVLWAMIGEVRACEPVLTCQFTPSVAAVVVLTAVSDETPEWLASWWNIGQVSADAAAGAASASSASVARGANRVDRARSRSVPKPLAAYGRYERLSISRLASDR